MIFLKKNILILLLIAFGSTLFFRCSSPPLLKTIDVPFPHLDIPFQKFTFLDEKGTQIRLSSGTLIQIPADILEDKEGNDATGEVELSFREMEQSLEVFRTGITMKYDSAERKSNFQTAGMFEIKVMQNSKELQIKSGKNVVVNSASQEGSSDYSFYELDKEKGWQYQSMSAVDSNFYKIRKLDSLSSLKEKIYPFGKEYFAFNYDVLLDVYFNDNWKKSYPNSTNERRNTKTVQRKIGKYGVQRLESTIPYDLIKTTTSRRPLAFWLWKFSSPTNIPNWINKKAKVEIQKSSTSSYTLTITNSEKNKKWVKTIQPIMPISQMYEHTPEDWRKNFRNYIKNATNSNLEELEKINQEMELIKKQADFIRTAQINGFGVFNHDKWIDEENAVTFTADFRFDDTKDIEMVTSIFVIPTEEKSVIKWNKYDNKWGKQILITNKKVRMCAVLPNNKIAVFEESEFEKLNFEEIKRTGKHTFYLKTYSKTIETTEDLEMALYGKLLTPEKEEKNNELSLLTKK
jgi:hypothetical protein